MKELVKVWLWSKVFSEVVGLAGIVFSVGMVAWLVFRVLPAAVGKVFGW